MFAMCREEGGSLFMGLGLGFRRVQEEVEDKKWVWIRGLRALGTRRCNEGWHKFVGALELSKDGCEPCWERVTNFCNPCKNLAIFRKGYEISQPLQNLLGFWEICYCKILDLHNFPCYRKITSPYKNEHKKFQIQSKKIKNKKIKKEKMSYK